MTYDEITLKSGQSDLYLKSIWSETELKCKGMSAESFTWGGADAG